MSLYMSGSKGVSLTSLIEKTQSRSASSESSKNHGGPKYEAFKPPPIDKDLLTFEVVRSRLLQVPGFHAAHPLNSSTVPGKYLPPGYSAPTVVNPLLTFTTGKYDGLQWMMFAQAEGIPAERKKSIQELVSKQYYGSGSVVGLVARLRAQIPPPEKTAPPVTPEEMSKILEMLPFDGEPSLAGEDATVLGLMPEINPDAHPGAPYFRSGVTMMDQGVPAEAAATAQDFLNILEEEGAAGLLAKNEPSHPDFPKMVMMLSAKTDVYERDEYLTKVRPFGVQGAPLRILGQIVVRSYKKHIIPFTKSRYSISAVGFAWTKGGARELLEWVLIKMDDDEFEPGIYNISFGDDQLMVVKCLNGDVFLMAPDVAGMDMKIGEHTFDAHALWQLSAYAPDTGALISVKCLSSGKSLQAYLDAGARIEPQWLNFVLFSNAYHKHHYVLTYKHAMILKKQGLFSGIPGTTEIDMVASARLVHAWRQLNPPASAKTAAHFRKQLVSAAAAVGFPIKPETLDMQLIRVDGKRVHQIVDADGDVSSLPPQLSIALPFLGMQLVTVPVPVEYVINHEKISVVVPVLPLERVVSNLVLRRIGKDDVTVEANKMQALISFAFLTAGDQQAFQYVRDSYRMRYKQGQRPFTDPELATSLFEQVPDEEILVLAAPRAVSTLPPRAYFLRAFATEEERSKFIAFTLEYGPTAEAVDEVHRSTAVEAIPPPSVPGVGLKSARKMDKPVQPQGGATSSKSSVPLGKLMKPNERQMVRNLEGTARKQATPQQPPLPRVPVVSKKAATEAPPNPVLRKANAERHKAKADEKYAQAMAAMSSASAASAPSKPASHAKKGKVSFFEEPTEEEVEEAEEYVADVSARQSRRETAAQEAADAEEESKEEYERRVSHGQSDDSEPEVHFHDASSEEEDFVDPLQKDNVGPGTLGKYRFWT